MQSPISDFYAVIPAGGIGSRLWPLSRADAPKFLHDLTGSGQTLLRDTWDRLAPLAGSDRIAVVTGRAHRAAVEDQLPGIADHNVILESEPRDSAAAIGLAAAILHRREPDVIIGSFAADHVIRGTRVFEFAVRDAVEVAREGYICTIGIAPSEPAVGFGYIKRGAELVVDGASLTPAGQLTVHRDTNGEIDDYVAEARENLAHTGVVAAFIEHVSDADTWAEHDGSLALERARIIDACYRSATEKREVVLG